MAEFPVSNADVMSAPQTPVAAKTPVSMARKIWRVVYWGLAIWGAWGIILMLRRAPEPQVATSQGAAQIAGQKLQGLLAPDTASVSPSEHQRIKLTEEEVNSLIAQRMPPPEQIPGQGIGTVRELKVTLAGDRARIYSLFTVAGKDLTLQMEGRLHVTGGYLQFEPTGGELGELSLSAVSLDLLLSRLMNDPEVREGFRMPATIRDVRVENSELVIERQ